MFSGRALLVFSFGRLCIVCSGSVFGRTLWPPGPVARCELRGVSASFLRGGIVAYSGLSFVMDITRSGCVFLVAFYPWGSLDPNCYSRVGALGIGGCAVGIGISV